jgi:hypothetical protein
MVTVEHNRNPQFSEAHLTTLNLDNFKMIEAMGLKIIELYYRIIVIILCEETAVDKGKSQEFRIGTRILTVSSKEGQHLKAL